jgi:F-type H+-transporting ATPase subunit a
MAEARPAEVEHAADSSGGADPLHHIKDQVLIALDRQGRLVRGSEAYEHGRPRAGYEPARLGPMRLEFTKHMAGVAVVAVLLAAVLIMVARRVTRNVEAHQASRGRLANAVEAVLVYLRDEVIKPSGGAHAAHYTWLFVTYFLFILTLNLAGMIPEAGAATGNIAVTGALGGSVFVFLTLLGMFRQGPLKYFLHLVPPGTPWWMWPLMFFLELTSPIIKCFVLCVRLFANMIAGHLVVANVLGIGVLGPKAMLPTALGLMSLFVGVPLALGISLLELLVCLIQAYVFTMLSVIFVGAAVHPEH